MDRLEIICPKCLQVLQIPKKFVGTRGTCRKCGASFVAVPPHSGRSERSSSTVSVKPLHGSIPATSDKVLRVVAGDRVCSVCGDIERELKMGSESLGIYICLSCRPTHGVCPMCREKLESVDSEICPRCTISWRRSENSAVGQLPSVEAAESPATRFRVERLVFLLSIGLGFAIYQAFAGRASFRSSGDVLLSDGLLLPLYIFGAAIVVYAPYYLAGSFLGPDSNTKCTG